MINDFRDNQFRPSIIKAVDRNFVMTATNLILSIYISGYNHFIFQNPSNFRVNFDASLVRYYEDMVEIVHSKKEQILDSRPLTHPSLINCKI